MARTLNLGILAHVDAGKTSLTERLLHAAGVIDEVGSVDRGTTQTDSLALERQRGITIKSAVVAFVVDDVTINLIDTPGHPDFIAEVERALAVLDGAVLVVSAVEGVQPQTRILMRALQRLRLPTLLFVNKIDRRGADVQRVLDGIGQSLTAAAVPMGSASDPATPDAAYVPFRWEDPAFADMVEAALAEHDDALLEAYVANGPATSRQRLRRSLVSQTGQCLVHPVFCGSALSGAGVEALIDGITELLPASDRDVDGPVSGAVFKVERGATGERVAFVRMYSGTVRVRDRLVVGDGEEVVTAIEVFGRGTATSAPCVGAGRIGKIWGLGRVRIGDPIGVDGVRHGGHHFAPPSLETVVLPVHRHDKGAVHAALSQLAEQDPLIDLRQDDVRQELFVSLYGEVQKEVIRDTLDAQFGLEVEFRETTPICIERPTGTGDALEVRGRRSNPFQATVGVRLSPAAVGAGVVVSFEIESGSIPPAFVTAVDETVRDTLRQGLCGWQVSDCHAAVTHCDHRPPPVPVGGFRNLTPLVVMAALQRAGTVVCEPIQHFRLELPVDALGAVLPALARLGAVPSSPEQRASSCTITGEIRAALVHNFQQQVPGLTRGEGVLECVFHAYEPVRGTTPTRPRSDHNPLHREEYLLHIARRV